MSLARTPLFDWHAAHGGRLVDFAGWEMPVQYTSIVPEHKAVRSAAGLFDIAHMGRLYFRGPQAARALESLLTNEVLTLQPGQVRYSLLTNDTGGILDDVLVYRLAHEHLLVVNASNRLKVVGWIQRHLGAFDVTLHDETTTRCMLALQGPRALDLLQPFVPQPLAPLKYYSAIETTIGSVPALISRTGYTGEDGFEIIMANAAAVDLWERLIAAGAPVGLLPCGLGCRDTLRLEAAMPLYGHELNEQIDPLSAGLKFAVKLEGRTFPGHPSLVARQHDTTLPRRVGLRLASRRIAREGTVVHFGGSAVGQVTSGTFSPTFEQSLAMAYVTPEASAVGTPVTVDIRGQHEPAEVVKLPFYKRPAIVK
ncbi:MAG: glycine cleavage system aminomethyltransferase GcvT [Planctomycetaceae bacterium]